MNKNKLDEQVGTILRKDLDFIAKCYKCGGVYILPDDGGWNCPHCGHYDGNNTSEIIFNPWIEEIVKN